MESNRAHNNQMALKGVVLVLALIAAGAFVLARGLDDDSPSSTAAEATPEATAAPVDDPEPDETSTPGEEPETDTSPAPEETTDPAPAPEETAVVETPIESEDLICRDPSTIGVLVANSTLVDGAARRLSAILNTSNYVTLPPVNAPEAQTSSAIYYRAGYEADAQCIAFGLGEGSGLGAGAIPVFVMSDPPPGGITRETLGNAFILVLIGPDSLAQSPG